ncbi:MAG: 4Fe-4S binding protein [Gemmatimonadota bacterium]|nr:MAG: 4Fe-4S binding protein [Gemmatimonadota bacterium]
MCEFCTKHGEGRKWYLEMKNYSRELLNEPLTPEEQEASGATTRAEYLATFCEQFIKPAATGEPKTVQQVLQTIVPSALRNFAAGNIAKAFEDHKLTHFGQVVTLEDAERVIDMVDSITRLPCGCRYLTTGKTDKRYCLGLGVDAQGMLSSFLNGDSFEVLTKEEAKSIIRDYDTEGLVHTVWTGVTPFIFGLCNCDRDCLAYKSYIEERGSPGFFRGEFVGEVEAESCSGCKDCLKQCQFGAVFYSSALGLVYLDPTRCFGCGVCRAACPTDAIRMVPRREQPKAANVWLTYP